MAETNSDDELDDALLYGDMEMTAEQTRRRRRAWIRPGVREGAADAGGRHGQPGSSIAVAINSIAAQTSASGAEQMGAQIALDLAGRVAPQPGSATAPACRTA